MRVFAMLAIEEISEIGMDRPLVYCRGYEIMTYSLAVVLLSRYSQLTLLGSATGSYSAFLLWYILPA